MLNLEGLVGGDEVVDAQYHETEEAMDVSQVYALDIIRPKFNDFKQGAARIATDAKALEVNDDKSLNLAVRIGGEAKRIAKAIDAKRKAIILEPSEFVKGVNGICKIITDSLDEAELITKEKIKQHNAKAELERLERERKAKEATAALQRKLQAEADEANRKAAEEARKRVEEEQRIRRGKEEEEARERGAKKAELDALNARLEEDRITALKIAEEEAAKIAVVAPTVVDPVVQEAPRVTRTESGSAAFSKKPWVFRIVNEAEVERQFLSIDEKKIRDAIRMGIRLAKGIEIYQDTQINFRS